MRITKRIEAYIREQVEEKYKDIDKAEYDKWDAARKAFNDACEEAAHEADAIIRQRFPEFFVGTDPERHVITTSTYFINNPFYDAYYVKKNEKKHLVEQKVQSILLQMELGGTKQELDDILNSLDVEEITQ